MALHETARVIIDYEDSLTGPLPVGSAVIGAMVPTQVRRPWRSTARTVFQALVALAVMLPFLVEASGVDETLAPVAGALAIAGGISRIMALPQVEAFLRRFLPLLAAGSDRT